MEIDCRQITKNTLWGEIAYRLDRYEEFEEMDTRREPPEDITSIKRIFDEPVLVMLDELPHYLFKADGIRVGKKTLGEQTTLFIMELISAVASQPNACLVLTLTENQSLYASYSSNIRSKIDKKLSDFTINELVGNLREAISRQAHTMTPVNPDQIYDVIKARLVKHVDEAERDVAIRAYADYYSKYGMDVGNILEKMEKSYPFHPGLIDILHGRVSTIDKFNQTRGVLRLLARVVRQIAEDKPDCKMIGTSEIQLDNAEIKDELTVRLGLNLGAVVDEDCVRHAKESDKTKSVNIVGPIASTIMLFSLHGHTKKSGIKRSEIKAAVGRPGLDPSLVDKALDDDIMNNFWYIYDVSGQEFYFDEFPNITAIIHEHRGFVTRAEIKDEIRCALDSLLPTGALKRVLWDKNALADSDSLKLFVTEYDADLSGRAGITYMEDILSKAGNAIRTNKNTIALVSVEPGSAHLLERTAKTLVAIKRAKRDTRIKINNQLMKQIASKESDAAAQLKSDCFVAYSNVLYPYKNNIRRSEIRFGESKKITITEAVVDLLESQGKLVRDVGPDGLEVGDEPVKAQKIYDRFAEDKSKPFILNKDSIGHAIKTGLQTGKFGYCTKIEMIDGKYVAEKHIVDFDWDGFLVRSDVTRTREDPDTPGKPQGPNGPTGPRPEEFYYTMQYDGFEWIHDLTKKMATLNLDDGWKSSRKSIRVDLSIGDVRMTLDGAMSDHKLIKDMLNIMSAKNPIGSATVNVVSTSNLEAFFKEYDLEDYVQ